MSGNFNYSPAPFTNKIVVNSLEDALSRYYKFNSDMACWDANQNVIYNIYTNGRGEKTYDIYDVSLRAPQKSSDDKTEVIVRLEQLERRVEELYGKHNVEQKRDATTATNATNTSNQ